MKLVERLVAIRDFFLRRNVMGLILLLVIGFSSVVTGYRHHIQDMVAAHTSAVASANTKEIEKLKTVVVAKPAPPSTPIVVPPVVIVEKVTVPVKGHPKHHGVLRKGTPLTF